MIKKIYVDMDDVVTNFNDYYEECFGRRWKDIADTAERWKPLNDNPDWYLSIPLKKDALQLMSYVRSLNVPVKMLTATGWDWVRVGTAKTIYCTKRLNVEPSDVLTVVEGRKKFAFARPGYVLIDDMERNVLPWCVAGGFGILHKNADDTIQQLKGLLVA